MLSLLRLFFRTAGEPLAVAMAGVKMGDRLLMVGCGDPLLVAKLAVKTGLTGRAFATDARPALAAAAEALAPREGALIETAVAPWPALPLEAGSFDVVVVYKVFGELSAAERAACAVDVHRVLRPGGRCLIIDQAEPAALSRIFHRPSSPEYDAAGGALPVLEQAGFRAARRLASRQALVFTEAARPNLDAGRRP